MKVVEYVLAYLAMRHIVRASDKVWCIHLHVKCKHPPQPKLDLIEYRVYYARVLRLRNPLWTKILAHLLFNRDCIVPLDEVMCAADQSS